MNLALVTVLIEEKSEKTPKSTYKFHSEAESFKFKTHSVTHALYECDCATVTQVNEECG